MGLAPEGRGPGPGSLLRNLKTTMLVVVGVLSVLADSATTKQDGVPQLIPVPQRWRHSPEDGLCPPGTHMSEDSRDCPSCSYGVDYTTHWNDLPSCRPCSVCNSDEEESSPCTMTANRECQCKAGTFRGEDSPEFCQKCRTRCPDGMVENRTCTPWSDLVCVPKGSGTKTSGEAPSPGRPVTASQGNSTCLLPSSDISLILIVILIVLAVIILGALLYCWCTRTGGYKNPKSMARFFCCGRSPRGPGAEDNARNEMLSNRDSYSSIDSQQKMEIEEPEVLAGVTVTSPGQSERLLNFQNDACPENDKLLVAQPAGCQAELEPRIPDSNPGCPHSLFPGQAGAEGSHRQRLLVPANGADPTDALRQSFDYFTHVPFHSWNRFMRRLRLTELDMEMARVSASCPEETLHEMLMRWLRMMGRKASVNTLLEALGSLGEKHARETIEAHLVNSGQFIYLEDEAGPALS
nr:tumor necrosis factor receptor superfamily member 10B-like isoform X2 [Microcebus murinus]